MTRRDALATLGKSSLAFFFGDHHLFHGSIDAAERPTDMTTPAYISKFTANNPGIMTLQGTNQYIVDKKTGLVIDVALSADSNMDGIIEQAEAMGIKKIEQILITHIHSDH